MRNLDFKILLIQKKSRIVLKNQKWVKIHFYLSQNPPKTPDSQSQFDYFQQSCSEKSLSLAPPLLLQLFLNCSIKMGNFLVVHTYLKSWLSSPQHRLQASKVISTLTRLVCTLQHKQLSAQKQALGLQHKLVQAIRSSPAMRSRNGEREYMELIIRRSELVAVYEEIIRCLRVIKGEAQLLEHRPQEIGDQCVVALSSVLYADKELELGGVVNLKDFVPEPRPQVKVQQISDRLRQYIEFKHASENQLNCYVLQMCQRNQIKLEVVNQAGHNFVQAMQSQQPYTKSAQMFALSLDEEQLEEMSKFTAAEGQINREEMGAEYY